MKIETILKNSPLNQVEAEILLSRVLNKDRSFLHAFSDFELSSLQVEKVQSLIKRRENHEPLSYLTGNKEFYGLNFLVNKNVLIPRPETETLVKRILDYSKNKQFSVADVGTGSGCIAISLALNNTKLKITATDISSKALEVAKKNARLYRVEKRIEFVQSNLLEKVDERINLIAANLPYIPEENWERLPTEIKNFEPKEALFSGSNSRTFYNRLFQQAKGKLNPNGKIFYEIDGKIFVK